MNERSTFEARLAAALQAYADGAPVSVDAAALAGAIASRRRRRSLAFDLPHVDRRWLAIGLLALLLAGLLASLYIGSRRLENRINPPGAVLVTDGSYECQGLYRVDLASATNDRLLNCVDRLLLSPDGTRGAYRDPAGLGMINLRNNSRTIVPGTEGLVTTPVAWSPRGTYLHWVSGDTLTGEQDHAFIGSIDDIRRTELPPQPPGGGYLCCVLWSRDESVAGFPSDSQIFVGGGDGSGATPVDVEEILAFSPDGSQMMIRVGRDNGSDIVLRDRSGTETNLTNFPIGTRADGAAWSDDGTIAVVSATRADSVAPLLVASDDLWLYAPDGGTRHFGLHLGDAPAGDVGDMIWSPDGTRLIVDFVDETRPGEPAVSAGRFLISTRDGSLTQMPIAATADSALPAFSPDGSMLLTMTGPNGQPGLNISTFDGAPPWEIDSLAGGPWTQFAWVN